MTGACGILVCVFQRVMYSPFYFCFFVMCYCNVRGLRGSCTRNGKHVDSLDCGHIYDGNLVWCGLTWCHARIRAVCDSPRMSMASRYSVSYDEEQFRTMSYFRGLKSVLLDDNGNWLGETAFIGKEPALPALVVTFVSAVADA